MSNSSISFIRQPLFISSLRYGCGIKGFEKAKPLDLQGVGVRSGWDSTSPAGEAAHGSEAPLAPHSPPFVFESIYAQQNRHPQGTPVLLCGAGGIRTHVALPPN